MKPGLLIALSGAFCLFAVGAAPAAVLYVNQNTPGATHNGASWTTAYLTVQDALTAAQNGDEVWVARGTYNEKLTILADTSLYGGFAGGESDRAQRDWTANPTVLAAPTPSDTVVTSQAMNATIDGFTIRDGKTGLDLPYGGNMAVSNDTFLHNGTGLSTGVSQVTAFRDVFSGCTTGVNTGPGAMILASSIVTANQTGVYNVAAATVLNNTITGNNNGIISGSYLVLENNIIAFNGGIGLNTLGALISHNDVVGNGTNYLALTDQTGTRGNISVDPKLSSIYRDGHIAPDSPCRNAGDNEFALGVLDVDGQPRIQDGVVDIGADESDGSTHTVTSRIWYVSPAGSDASDGSSWLQARKTLDGTLSLAHGGDEVWVAKGTYAESAVVPAGVALYGGFAGTETARSQRDWTANPTVIDGGGTPNTVVSLGFTGGVLDGFTVQNGSSNGLDLKDGTILEHCTVVGNKVGALVEGQCGLEGNSISSNTSDGLDVYGGVVTLTGNSIGSNGGAGIREANATVSLSRNAIGRNAGDGVALSGPSSTLADNVIVGNGGHAVMVTASSGQTTLNNNTLEGNNIGITVNVTLATVRVTNSIIAFNTTIGVQAGHGAFEMAHSDVYGNATNYEQVDNATIAANLSQDPLFLSTNPPLFRNLHLKAGSPCIDTGDDSVVTAGELDYDGRPRILGAHVDMGAYEFVPAGFATMADVLNGLRITGGLATASSADLTALNVENPGTPLINLSDAVRLARKVAGLDPNP